MKTIKIFLISVKERLRAAQIRASLAVNAELVKFYWQLGGDILKRQKEYRWGESFLEQFSRDIRQAFPGMQGFSVSNLKRMRIVAKEYPKSPQPVDQIPWGHIFVLIHVLKTFKLVNGISKKLLKMDGHDQHWKYI